MKVKLDENLPSELAAMLAGVGHDVHTVPQERLAGRDDPTVFAAAQAEGRLFITQDFDFADIRKYAPGTHAGLVHLRLRHPSRTRIVGRLRDVLAAERLEDWARCFVVITDLKIRVRRP